MTDHVEILQDHSALFRTLAFFEEDLEARCKMHKRRIDMLEPVCNGKLSFVFLFNFFTSIKVIRSLRQSRAHGFCIPTELNSQYYLMIRRQMMFELAETYEEMMNLKMTRANTQADAQALDKHSIKKINHLCSSAVK